MQPLQVFLAHPRTWAELHAWMREQEASHLWTVNALAWLELQGLVVDEAGVWTAVPCPVERVA